MNERDFRLLRRLTNICAGIKEQVEAIAEHASRNEKPAEPKPSAEPQRVSLSPIEFSEEVTKKYYAEQDKGYSLQTWTFWATVATGVVVLAYTTAAYLQLGPIERSATAAKSAADTAHDTLIATNRPWLDISAVAASSMDFDKDGGHINIGITTTNVGHSPAVRVTEQQELIQVLVGRPNPWDEIKRLCALADGESKLPSNKGLTETIFVGRPQPKEWALTLARSELDRNLGSDFGVTPPPKPASLFPVVVWCTAYQADFSPVVHHTGYAWSIYKRSAVSGSGVDAIDPKVTSIPLNQLLVVKYSFVGPFAD